MKTLAIALQKGGVGKTTTTATLAHALGLLGQRVLAVDLDPQGSLAKAFGLDPAPALYDWLNDYVPVGGVIVQARPMVDLVRSDQSTAKLKENLTGVMFREQVLARALKAVRTAYDWALLDCAPSLDILNVAAMVAADGLILPVAVDYMALVGLRQHLQSLRQLQDLGYPCRVRLIVPTMYERVTKESAEILGRLKEAFGDDLVADPIPRNTRVREAPAYKKTLLEHAPTSPAAEGYWKIVRRLVNGR